MSEIDGLIEILAKGIKFEAEQVFERVKKNALFRLEQELNQEKIRLVATATCEVLSRVVPSRAEKEIVIRLKD